MNCLVTASRSCKAHRQHFLVISRVAVHSFVFTQVEHARAWVEASVGPSPGPDLRLQRVASSRRLPTPKGHLLPQQCQEAFMSLTDAQTMVRSGEGKCQLLLKGSKELNEISSLSNIPL